ncbi:MAG TPA: hypothetical protein VFP60_06090 [Pseudolabrys sp.]|nr:hypothetical protein [Pseudolabrys sp.]
MKTQNHVSRTTRGDANERREDLEIFREFLDHLHRLAGATVKAGGAKAAASSGR